MRPDATTGHATGTTEGSGSSVRTPGRVWARRILAGLGAIVLAVLLAPSPLVDPIARRIVSGYGDGCAKLSGVRVDSGPWPVVLRGLAGQLRDVSVEIDEIRFETFSVHDVRTSAGSVGVAPLGLSLAGGDAQVQDGVTSAAMSFADIEQIYAEHGVTLSLRRDDRDPSRLVADVDVPFIGPVPTAVTVTPAEGDMELRLAPLDLIELPPILITAAEPFEVRSVDVGRDAVRITSTFDGTLRAGDFGCDVATG